MILGDGEGLKKKKSRKYSFAKDCYVNWQLMNCIDGYLF